MVSSYFYFMTLIKILLFFGVSKEALLVIYPT